MPGGIGPLELAIVLVIVLIVFGPKKLPGLGRSLGSGMREFKESITGSDKDDDRERPELSATSADEAPREESREPVREPAREPARDSTATEERDDAVSRPRG